MFAEGCAAPMLLSCLKSFVDRLYRWALAISPCDEELAFRKKSWRLVGDFAAPPGDLVFVRWVAGEGRYVEGGGREGFGLGGPGSDGQGVAVGGFSNNSHLYKFLWGVLAVWGWVVEEKNEKKSGLRIGHKEKTDHKAVAKPRTNGQAFGTQAEKKKLRRKSLEIKKPPPKLTERRKIIFAKARYAGPIDKATTGQTDFKYSSSLKKQW